MNLREEISKKLVEFADKLWEIHMTYEEKGEDWSGGLLDKANNPGVRMIGECLDDIGGFEAMQKMAYAIYNDKKEKHPRDATDFLSCINYAWSGIGEWQA